MSGRRANETKGRRRLRTSWHSATGVSPLRRERGLFFFQRGKIPVLAARHESFRDRFQLLPPRADFLRFRLGDLIVRGRHGDDRQQVGEFLDDLVRGGNQKVRMRLVGFRIPDEEPAGALANPLHESRVAGAFQQGFDAVEWIDRAATIALVRFGPLVNHGKREPKVGSDLFGAGFLKDFAEKFVRLHMRTMRKRENVGKRNGWNFLLKS